MRSYYPNLYRYFSFIPLDAEPSEEEREIHSKVAAVLDKAPVILDKLFKYDGCEEYIRKVFIRILFVYLLTR